MANIIDFMKKRKLFSSLIFILIIGIISSLIFVFLLSEDNFNLMKDSVNGYFNNISNNNINYLNNFIISIFNNISIAVVIWLFGISIIGSLFIYVLFFIKSFTISLSFISIISLYGFNGILISIIYIVPYIISLGVLFVLSYYSISFSVILIKHLFRGFNYNRKVIVKRYVKVLLFCCLLLFICSLLDVFLVPRILLLF